MARAIIQWKYENYDVLLCNAMKVPSWHSDVPNTHLEKHLNTAHIDWRHSHYCLVYFAVYSDAVMRIGRFFLLRGPFLDNVALTTKCGCVFETFHL